MNRRDFLKTLGCGAAAFAMQGCNSVSGFSSGKSAKPNIILIMADDIGYECFGCYGSASYKTPVLDGMAETGMRPRPKAENLRAFAARVWLRYLRCG